MKKCVCFHKQANLIDEYNNLIKSTVPKTTFLSLYNGQSSKPQYSLCCNNNIIGEKVVSHTRVGGRHFENFPPKSPMVHTSTLMHPTLGGKL